MLFVMSLLQAVFPNTVLPVDFKPKPVSSLKVHSVLSGCVLTVLSGLSFSVTHVASQKPCEAVKLALGHLQCMQASR